MMIRERWFFSWYFEGFERVFMWLVSISWQSVSALQSIVHNNNIASQV